MMVGVSAVSGNIFVYVKKAEEVSSLVRGENPGNGPQEGVCSINKQRTKPGVHNRLPLSTPARATHNPLHFHCLACSHEPGEGFGHVR